LGLIAFSKRAPSKRLLRSTSLLSITAMASPRAFNRKRNGVPAWSVFLLPADLVTRSKADSINRHAVPWAAGSDVCPSAGSSLGGIPTTHNNNIHT
jgi:hypothetical protein